jgi:hypothetical protein
MRSVGRKDRERGTESERERERERQQDFATEKISTYKMNFCSSFKAI